MFERGITEIDVREVLEHGQILKMNPKDSPYPSYLMLVSFRAAGACCGLG